MYVCTMRTMLIISIVNLFNFFVVRSRFIYRFCKSVRLFAEEKQTHTHTVFDNENENRTVLTSCDRSNSTAFALNSFIVSILTFVILDLDLVMVWCRFTLHAIREKIYFVSSASHRSLSEWEWNARMHTRRLCSFLFLPFLKCSAFAVYAKW